MARLIFTAQTLGNTNQSRERQRPDAAQANSDQSRERQRPDAVDATGAAAGVQRSTVESISPLRIDVGFEI
jgi:hypothetical protein